MKLYLLTRTDDWNYNCYDSFVVAAESKENALSYHPKGKDYLSKEDIENKLYYGWTSKENLRIQCIGESNSLKEKVIIYSYNAG